MTITFTAGASGEEPVSWRWQGAPDAVFWDNLTDGSTYSGVNTNELSVNVEDSTLDGWWYRAVVSNACDELTTGSAMLTITNGTGG
jgi:hypothetical protein